VNDCIPKIHNLWVLANRANQEA